jgi:hypothetical protein
MRPFGRFIYNLNNSGYMVGKIVSEVEIHRGDALYYNGNRLYVLSKNDDVLTVKKTGNLISIRKLED